jgi:predicted kinase
MSKKLVLIQGLPGSGKSTLAEKIAKDSNGKIFTTDEFFMVDGEYRFEYKFISAAHKWNMGRAAQAMFLGEPLIVVPNTNLQDWELLPYVEVATDAGYEVEILEPKTKWKNDVQECANRNTHGVPLATIEKMAAKKETVKQMKDSISTKLARLGKNVVWA